MITELNYFSDIDFRDKKDIWKWWRSSSEFSSSQLYIQEVSICNLQIKGSYSLIYFKTTKFYNKPSFLSCFFRYKSLYIHYKKGFSLNLTIWQVCRLFQLMQSKIHISYLLTFFITYFLFGKKYIKPCWFISWTTWQIIKMFITF